MRLNDVSSIGFQRCREIGSRFSFRWLLIAALKEEDSLSGFTLGSDYLDASADFTDLFEGQVVLFHSSPVLCPLDWCACLWFCRLLPRGPLCRSRLKDLLRLVPRKEKQTTSENIIKATLRLHSSTCIDRCKLRWPWRQRKVLHFRLFHWCCCCQLRVTHRGLTSLWAFLHVVTITFVIIITVHVHFWPQMVAYNIKGERIQ